jgi:hypothetical protein
VIRRPRSDPAVTGRQLCRADPDVDMWPRRRQIRGRVWPSALRHFSYLLNLSVRFGCPLDLASFRPSYIADNEKEQPDGTECRGPAS